MSMSADFTAMIEGECSLCEKQKEVVVLNATKGSILGQQQFCRACIWKALRMSCRQKSVPVAAPTATPTGNNVAPQPATK